MREENNERLSLTSSVATNLARGLENRLDHLLLFAITTIANRAKSDFRFEQATNTKIVETLQIGH